MTTYSESDDLWSVSIAASESELESEFDVESGLRGGCRPKPEPTSESESKSESLFSSRDVSKSKYWLIKLGSPRSGIL